MIGFVRSRRARREFLIGESDQTATPPLKFLLFVTWDGPQTSYLESLFLPLFERLVGLGWQIHVLQFHWAKEESINLTRNRITQSGIAYSPHLVRKDRGLFGIVASIFCGVFRLRQIASSEKSPIVLFRSIVPALIVQLACLSSNTTLIYDSDGLPIEEKLEQGSFKKGALTAYLLLRVERRALKRSSAVLARTSKGAQLLDDKIPRASLGEKIYVVSNGRATPRSFRRDSPRRGQQKQRSLTLCYLGSWGPNYCPDRMIQIARDLYLRFPEVRFQIMTGDIESAARDIQRHRLGSSDWISIERVAPEKVEASLSSCDVGFSFRVPSVANSAVSPVKIGEYLAAGLFVIGEEVGDQARSLLRQNVMFNPDAGSPELLDAWVVENVISRRHARRKIAVRVATELFGLEEATQQYDRILQLVSASR